MLNTVENTLDLLKTLRDLNQRDYEDTKDLYFRGKVDAYNLVINHMEELENVKPTN